MNKNVLEYKGFIASVSYNDEDECFFGKIEGISDLVSFEGNTVKIMKKAFYDAVDDYINLCKETGKESHKSIKGSFNVRIDKNLHHAAMYAAIKKGISLNQYVADAIQNSVKRQSRPMKLTKI